MTHPFFVASTSRYDALEAAERTAVVEGRLLALRAAEAADFNIKSMIPPGYQLTKAAKDRLEQLDAAFNRRERRALLAHFRRNPIDTFEKVPTP